MISKSAFRIVFMGTPDFAVESLRTLVENNYNVVGVVTNPDKPAGRGQQIRESPVKKYAKEQNLPILQPVDLSDKDFIQRLKALQPALQVVVAFKILPPEVFNIPEYGTFNLHASLLPDYRGAAPINHVIINGEQKTGVTTFFLDDKVDTGKIIMKKETEIAQDETAGTLHDKLMFLGADLVRETVEAIQEDNYQTVPQDELIKNRKSLKKAPKIFKDDCRIKWDKTSYEIYNFIRGLTPYPGAQTVFTNSKQLSLKIFMASPEKKEHNYACGTVFSDHKSFIKVATSDGFIRLEQIQQSGKKRMDVKEFLKGFRNIEEYKAV
ncbi:MAG: methionyl-tRNA formyltransferase [Bacteroidales bacterium]|nr:methionyl-tRNA formyltransferase [Bacteroidales bacterium]